jgi:hypothetical protein
MHLFPWETGASESKDSSHALGYTHIIRPKLTCVNGMIIPFSYPALPPLVRLGEVVCFQWAGGRVLP